MYSRKTFGVWGLAVCLLLLTASCNRNVFDEDYYKELVEVAQPIESIDKAHQWDLTSTHLLSVDVTTSLKGMRRLQILSANPVFGDNATILGDFPLSGGNNEYVGFSAPSVATNFYAALVDDEGTYTVKPFSAGQRSINFSNPSATKAKVESRQLEHQAFTYLFEDEMPEPGDYDFNDVVLRISQERPAANQLKLNVTIAAVGSLTQVAAAVRLVDIKYEDIKQVTTLDGTTFDDEYRKSALPYINDNNLFMKGSSGEVVINLFEDAHWATGAASYTSEGYIPRLKYNVLKAKTPGYDMVSPRTVSYIITFENPALLNYFTLASLDPFVVVEYNGVLMETHAVYKYHQESVLHDYSQPDNAIILPWALTIPSASFRYPLDGVNIGYAKDGALFGAFMTTKHSFGEWAANQKTALDWYNYPSANQVY